MPNRRSVNLRWPSRLRTGILALSALMTVVAVSAVTCAGPAAATHHRGAPERGDSSGHEVSWRGAVVSWKPLGTLTGRADVDGFLRKESFDTGTDRYGVSTYQLVYRTVGPTGAPTTASGLLAVPRNGQRLLAPVSFAHGTQIFTRDAPSTSSDGFLTAPPVTFASAGFAAVAPDYLGLGEGPAPHPWMDVPSETTASLDLLRAARTFLGGHDIQLRRDVLATGFSQGASAALGLGRALQGGADSWFRLGGLAPISGAYDFQGAQIPAMLRGELQPKFSVAYTAYLLAAFNRLHHIYATPSTIFRPAYVDVADLFDGTHSGEDVLNGLPDTLSEVLTPAGFDLLAHPTGAFAAALAVLDSVCSDWTPTAPVRLYLSPGDDEAADTNSAHCQESFAAHGVQIPTVNVGINRAYSGYIHEGSELLGTAAVARWFLTMR